MSWEASFTAKDFLVATVALMLLFLLWIVDRIGLLLMLLELIRLVIGGLVRVIDCFSFDL